MRPSEVANPRVVIADPRSDARWHSLAQSGKASVFVSPPWLRAVCGAYGFTPRAWIATDRHGRPTDGFAWVPITDMRGDRMVSLPFSDRAEPFVAEPATWSSVLDDVVCPDMPLTLRCLDGSVPTADGRLVRTAEAAWHATTLDHTVAQLHQSISPAARRNIATAERNGVSVVAESGIDAVRTYHRMHVSLRKYKYRLLAQPLDLFERIWHEFSAHDGIVTFLARVDGNPIAGAVHLAWNDTLYYKFGASLAGTLPLRPNDALFWAALRWASERGYRQLDWGLSDLDQPGLVAFKQKWASEERRIVTLCSPAPNSGNGHHAGKVLAELTRLLTDDSVPDTITEQAGALLYRYFT